jgi:hypothetical protein
MTPVSGRLPELLAPPRAMQSYSQRAYADMLRQMEEDDDLAQR